MAMGQGSGNGGNAMNTSVNRIAGVTATLGLIVSVAIGESPQGNRDRVFGSQRLNEKIRKELVTLPYYGVFDNLAFQVQGSTVILYGEVVRPVTRHDAEARVKRL